MALPITGGNGSPTGLTNTQTPQSSVAPSTGAAPSGNVQPGTATSILSTSTAQGINLKNQILPTVTVSGDSTGTIKQATKDTAPPKHHTNGVLVGLAVLLLVVAVVFFWLTARSEKNTTE